MLTLGKQTNWLTPRFENFPSELRVLNRWVVWKGNKIPFDPKRLTAQASITNDKTWGTFEQAQQAYLGGGFSGIGFVLNGDGIAGVDIDKCIVDGKPDERALEILKCLNASYIEISPSGLGLRSFGFSKPITMGKCGLLHGQKVEFYTQKRYLTLTGHTLMKGDFGSYYGFDELALRIGLPTEDTDYTEGTEETECNSSISSSCKPTPWPINAIPKKIGERHKKLFLLARWYKGREPEATLEQKLALVESWFSAYENVIGSKDFGLSWAEFRLAWDNVEYPHGAALSGVLNDLPKVPHIPGLIAYGNKAQHLMQICLGLQIRANDREFFLSCRIAGELIGLHYTDAATLLRAFVSEGWLELVAKGAGSHASRYRLRMNEI